MPAKQTIRGKRHDLGKAELVWGRWEKLGGGSRVARYGKGLNGDNRGASVIVIEVDRVGTKYRWEVFEKNDYGDLLPQKFKGTITDYAKSQAAGKKAAEIAVGLRPATSAKKGKASPSPAHFYNAQSAIYQLSRADPGLDRLIRDVPTRDGWDVQVTRSSSGWAAEASSTRLGKSYSSKRQETANRALKDLREVLANHEISGVSI